MSADTALEVGRLYAPIKKIADILTLAQQDTFIRLPGLRGYWPMSIVNSTGAAVDHSHASADLSRTGAPLFDYDGNAYIQVGVATDFLFNSTGVFGITGTEVWIASGMRGLTFGGWFRVDSTPATDSGLISKFGNTPQYGFALTWLTTNAPRLMISGNGTTVSIVTAPVRAIDTWYFIVGRFTPSVEVAIFVNDVKTINTTSIPASVNVSVQAFEVGRYFNDNGRIVEGKARDLFICATALPDALIEQIRLSSAP